VGAEDDGFGAGWEQRQSVVPMEDLVALQNDLNAAQRDGQQQLLKLVASREALKMHKMKLEEQKQLSQDQAEW
jgi:hypothetical protein